MIKLFLWFISSCVILNAQQSQKTATPPYYYKTPVISLKAGYHGGDSRTETYYAASEIPQGFSADINLEFPFGKGFFGSFNLDLSFAHGKIYDVFLNKDIEGNYKIINITFLMLKYRYFLKSFCINASTGIGITNIYTKFSSTYSPIKNNMVHYALKIGTDYLVHKKIAISIEGTYYGMQELKIDMGGGFSRSNNLFQIKGGLSLFTL